MGFYEQYEKDAEKKRRQQKKEGKVDRCKRCGKLFALMDLSRKKLCMKCALKNAMANMDGMIYRRGPYYEKWKSRMLSYLESLKKEA